MRRIASQQWRPFFQTILPSGCSRYRLFHVHDCLTCFDIFALVFTMTATIEIICFYQECAAGGAEGFARAPC
jgi:hypothetical protein